MNDTRKPIANLRTGAAFSLQVSVWPAERGFTISYRKTIKQDDGSYKEVKSLFASEALALSHLLIEAVKIGDAFAAQNKNQQNTDTDLRSEATNNQPHDTPSYQDADIPF
jgi:hypothetical protein